MSVASKLLAMISVSGRNPYGLGTVNLQLGDTKTNDLTDGDGDGEADAAVTFSAALAWTAGPRAVEVDLYDLEDAFGNAIQLTAVKGLLLKNTSSYETGSTVRVSKGDVLGWYGPFGTSGQIDVPPGGAVMLDAPGAGYEVTSLLRWLKFAHQNDGADAVTIEVTLIGVKA